MLTYGPQGDAHPSNLPCAIDKPGPQRNACTRKCGGQGLLCSPFSLKVSWQKPPCNAHELLSLLQNLPSVVKPFIHCREGPCHVYPKSAAPLQEDEGTRMQMLRAWKTIVMD